MPGLIGHLCCHGGDAVCGRLPVGAGNDGRCVSNGDSRVSNGDSRVGNGDSRVGNDGGGLGRLRADNGNEHRAAEIAIVGAQQVFVQVADIRVAAEPVLQTPFAGGIRNPGVVQETKHTITRPGCHARGAGDVGDDVTLLADEGIGEARLAYVGTSDDCDTGQVECVLDIVGLGQLLEDEVQEVACAAACGRADAEGISEAESVELCGLPLLVVVVGLVGNEDDGLVRATQDSSHSFIEVSDARVDVHEEEDDVGLLGGEGDLLTDFFLEDVV